MRASAVTVWINCRLSQRLCGHLNLTLLLMDCDNLFDGDVDPDISFSNQEGKGEKLNGSNHLLVLAKVNGGQERYENVRLLLERLKLQKLDAVITKPNTFGNLYLQFIDSFSLKLR